ncbi:MAG: hypothetical protein ACI9LE_000619 [Paraglaciecola sp.]|jgi:hypothetical protein
MAQMIKICVVFILSLTWVNNSKSRLFILSADSIIRCIVMKQNVGILDTAIRSILGVACLSLAAEGFFPQAISIALLLVGSLLWVTSSFGVCFIYKILNLDTYPGAGHGLTQWYPRD